MASRLSTPQYPHLGYGFVFSKLDSVWARFDYGCLYTLLLTHFKVVFECFNVPNYSNGNSSSTAQLIRYFLSFAFRTLLASPEFGRAYFRVQHSHGIVPSKIRKNCSLFKVQHVKDAPQLDPSLPANSGPTTSNLQHFRAILHRLIEQHHLFELTHYCNAISALHAIVMQCSAAPPQSMPCPAGMNSGSITMRETITPNLLLA